MHTFCILETTTRMVVVWRDHDASCVRMDRFSRYRQDCISGSTSFENSRRILNEPDRGIFLSAVSEELPHRPPIGERLPAVRARSG